MVICLRCQKEIDANQIFKLSRCKHQFCFKCLCNYVSKNLQVTVKCPVNVCREIISDANIRECLSNDLIDQYEAFSLSTCSKSIHKCLTKTCPFYIMAENDSIIFHCSYCGQPNCLKCKKRHYPNQICKRKVDEAAMDAEAEKNIKSIQRKQMDSMDKDNDLLPNSESFICSNCSDFILPRKGVILRNCLDCFCKFCLDNTFAGYRFRNQFTCPIPTCKKQLREREAYKLSEMTSFLDMSIKEKCYKYFNCQYPDCQNYWSCSKKTGFHKCEKCGANNCLSCTAIHNGKTCKEYLDSEEFKTQYKPDEPGIDCWYCGKFLIKAGGCAALACNHCNHITCEHTGKATGDEGCKCKSDAPCHKNCTYGCIPDT